MAKKSKPPACELESYLKLAVNGHLLTGEKHDGRWRFVCDDYPDLAKAYSGDAAVTEAVEAFLMRALIVEVTAAKSG